MNPDIVTKLKAMLDQYNLHAKAFRMARDRLKHGPVPDLKLRLISERSTDGRIYNLPTVSEVAALIVGDVDYASKRDIIMQTQSGHLERIDELHTSYLGYQYPLIFPYGEDGYRDDVLHRARGTGAKVTIRNRLTMREWLSFRIQTRNFEAQTLMHARRLFQQFLVDGYTMIESERLTFLRRNQAKLRVDKYKSLNDKDSDGQTQGANKGKRIVLPSTFVGGKRYMAQLYFDGMAICSNVGFPDLFITFTCNPCWPEIQRILKPLNLNPQDRPDIVSRVFKIKFDEFLKDLTKKGLLGMVVACKFPHYHFSIALNNTFYLFEVG